MACTVLLHRQEGNMAGLRLLISVLTVIPLLMAEAAAQDYRLWDRNRDGVITRSEWRGTPQDFRERDGNRDGVLSGDELPQQGLDDDSEAFASIDRNRDGIISRSEWRGDRAAFLRADRNRDSQITRSEFMNSNAGFVDDDLADFDVLDENANGRIERLEWRGTGPAFNRLDINRDGVLNRREFASDAVVARADPIDDVILVDPRQEWTDTGIFVNPGDVVTFRAQGTIQMTTGADDRATPAGSLTGRTASNSPRPDLRAGMLLVRIGDAIEAAGASGTFRARNSGRLLLGVNDDHFADNSGEYRMRLSISPR
jgi:Ca2+-binding EF-hand superfamily protein